jgi:hypothetical protein
VNWVFACHWTTKFISHVQKASPHYAHDNGPEEKALMCTAGSVFLGVGIDEVDPNTPTLARRRIKLEPVPPCHRATQAHLLQVSMSAIARLVN